MSILYVARNCILSFLMILAGCGSTPDPRVNVSASATSLPAGKADPYVVLDSRQTLTLLTSDEMEGRGVGTAGLDAAADYIANRFRSLGLRTIPGTSGYFQTFPFTMANTVGKETSLTSADKPLALRTDFTPASFSAEGTFAGQVVFAGYGISNWRADPATQPSTPTTTSSLIANAPATTAPQPTTQASTTQAVATTRPTHYDDYLNIDVKGKAVLVMRYEPHNSRGRSLLTGDDYSPAASLIAKATAAIDHGAVALILVNPPEYHGNQDMLLPFADQFGAAATIPVIHIKQTVADEILKQGGAPDLAALQHRIDSSGKPESVVLNGIAISGNVQIERKKSVVKNVMAMLPGFGPHAGEYVVVGAHYDHLGRGMRGSRKPGSTEIHHGADDNASGTTAVLELAGKLARAGRLDRSVIFVCFTAEEHGLIGSKYFVDHPPVPLEKIVAMLNMDMVGRVRNQTLYIGGAGTADRFDSILKSADDASLLDFKPIGRGGFGPSDHMSFALKKVPVLFLFSGMHPEYHTPADTPEKINYVGIAQVVKVTQDIVGDLATIPKPAYVSASDSQPTLIGQSSDSTGGDPARRASLGVVPDYGTDQSKDGVRISGTVDGSAAAAAGLKEGDVIVQAGDMKIESLMDLTNFLAKAKPGDKVKIILLRDGKKVECEATLTERRG